MYRFFCVCTRSLQKVLLWLYKSLVPNNNKVIKNAEMCWFQIRWFANSVFKQSSLKNNKKCAKRKILLLFFGYTFFRALFGVINSTFCKLWMQMPKNWKFSNILQKVNFWSFHQYISFSAWFPLSLKHWSPPNRQHLFLFSGFCDKSQCFSIQYSGSLNRFNLQFTLYHKRQLCFPKILKPTFQFKNKERKNIKAINHTVSSMNCKLDRTFWS